MSQRDLYGPETLLVPAYLATGPDDPGLAAWKREHPDWFEAGTWTRPADPADERRERRREATRTVGVGRERPPLDPATISVADFQRVAAEARGAAGLDQDDPAEQAVASSGSAAPRNGSKAPMSTAPRVPTTRTVWNGQSRCPIRRPDE